MSMFTIALAAFVATVAVAEDVALPPSIKTCKKDSDDYSSCLRLAIQESWPTIVQGIPELGIPTLDPFEIGYMDHTLRVGDVLGRMVVKNVKSYGIAKAKFLSVKPKHETGRFSLTIDFVMPKVLVEGDHKVDGTIGAFRIGGKGQFNISMEDVRTTWELKGPVVNDKWIIESFTLTPEVGKMTVWASDLFNGNAELTKAALAFANEYWPILYKGMLPYVSEKWHLHLRDLAANIFSKLSFASTFP